MASPAPSAAPLPRVLLVEESLPYRRVIREALLSFRRCEVDDTPSAERAFEMALHRPYQLFLFAEPLPDMSGILLDRLLTRAYPLAHPGYHTAPPVLFLLRTEDSTQHPDLTRNSRVRGILHYPPKLDALLSLTASLLPEAQPGLPHVP